MTEIKHDDLNQPVLSRLAILKEEADTLGMKYPNNITADKLEKQIEEYKEQIINKKKDEVSVSNYNPSLIGRVKAEAHKLVRFKLVVNNPNLQEATGIQITAGNDVIGHISRVIPTNAEVWHAEAIIVEHLKNMKFQQFKSKRRSDGTQYVDSKDSVLVPSFTIIELPPLSEEELEQLRIQQSRQNTGRSED